jgi:hypothetical protein
MKSSSDSAMPTSPSSVAPRPPSTGDRPSSKVAAWQRCEDARSREDARRPVCGKYLTYGRIGRQARGPSYDHIDALVDRSCLEAAVVRMLHTGVTARANMCPLCPDVGQQRGTNEGQAVTAQRHSMNEDHSGQHSYLQQHKAPLGSLQPCFRATQTPATSDSSLCSELWSL